jgi:hypothetical protein
MTDITAVDVELDEATTPLKLLVDQLARHHQANVTYEQDGKPATRVAWKEPLLAELRTAIHSSTGQTHSGHSAANERSTLNMQAFTLYEDISGRIASMFASATDARPDPLPEINLTDWFDTFAAAHAAGDVIETQMALAWERLTNMIDRIADMFDPPVTKEILGDCPNCGVRYARNDTDESRVSAVYAQYRRGGHVTALCRACGTEWFGESRLVELARGINASTDFEQLAEIRKGG